MNFKKRKGPTVGSRVAASLNARVLAAKRREVVPPLSVGCRYQDAGTGCRCGEEVEGNSAFCNKHLGQTPREIPGLDSVSLGRRSIKRSF